MKKLALKELDSLFAAIAAQQALYLPQDDAAGQAQFAAWKEGAALSKRLNTARSAKDLFFPQVENLAGFKREGKSIEIFETREHSPQSVQREVTWNARMMWKKFSSKSLAAALLSVPRL